MGHPQIVSIIIREGSTTKGANVSSTLSCHHIVGGHHPPFASRRLEPIPGMPIESWVWMVHTYWMLSRNCRDTTAVVVKLPHASAGEGRVGGICVAIPRLLAFMPHAPRYIFLNPMLCLSDLFEAALFVSYRGNYRCVCARRGSSSAPEFEMKNNPSKEASFSRDPNPFPSAFASSFPASLARY